MNTFTQQGSADPRLLGALRKTVCGGGRMNEMHFSVFHLVSNRAHGKRSRNSLFRCSVRFFFFFLKQETVRHSRYMI